MQKKLFLFLLLIAILFCIAGCVNETKKLENEALSILSTARYTPVVSTHTAFPTSTFTIAVPAVSTPAPTQPPAVVEKADEADSTVETMKEENPFDSTAQPTPSAKKYVPMVVDPSASGADWRSLPVVPTGISQAAKAIYSFGVKEMGRNGKAFSRIGDCQSYPNVFLGMYDAMYGNYELSAADQKLEKAIEFFQDSFNQGGYAISNGMSAASVLTATWSDPSICQLGESALDCDLRVSNPSIVFVGLGTNWNVDWDVSIYEGYFEEIIYHIIEEGTLPIVITKSDDVERGGTLNAAMVKIAKKYGVPVMNFWAISSKMPNAGLDAARDNLHLAMDAWPIRSYWALRTLFAVGQGLGLF